MQLFCVFNSSFPYYFLFPSPACFLFYFEGPADSHYCPHNCSYHFHNCAHCAHHDWPCNCTHFPCSDHPCCPQLACYLSTMMVIVTLCFIFFPLPSMSSPLLSISHSFFICVSVPCSACEPAVWLMKEWLQRDSTLMNF